MHKLRWYIQQCAVGQTSIMCIDHIFTNNSELCSKEISASIGFSDHNIVAIVRKTSISKVGPKILHKGSFRRFCENDFIRDIGNINWNQVLILNEVEKAIQLFNELFTSVADRHAPLRKFSVGAIKVP